ncbi:MAG: phage tail protein [Leptospirillia bacterium]
MAWWVYAIYAVVSWVLYEDAKREAEKEADRIAREMGGRLLNKDGNVEHIPVVYGTRRVGGTRVFMGTSGEGNAHLHIVLVLGEGEIEAVDAVYLDDVPVTDPRFDGLVTVTAHTGTDTQAADPDLVASFADWTNTGRLRGVAYLHVKLTYDRDAFSGVPTITADVRGRKLYDPRTGIMSFSANPALALYDYLTNPRYGKGLATTDLDVQSFLNAADICEEQIETFSGSGVTIDRFACNGVVDTGKAVADNVRGLLTACRGSLPFSGGRYALRIEGAGVSGFSFTEDNIVGGWEFGGAVKRDRMNRTKGQFTNPDRNWQPDLMVADSAPARIEDGNLLLERVIRLPFETDAYRALYHAETALKKSREGIAVSFTATLEALQVEVGDVVDVTHTTPGWNAKTFRVTGLALTAGGNVDVRLREYDATVYDRSVPASAFAPSPNTNLPDPYTVHPPSGLILTSGTNDLVVNASGSIVSRIRAAWTPAADVFVDEYEVQYKAATSGLWLPVGRGNATETHIAPVEDGVAYDVRVRAINTLGVTSPWVTSLGHVVIGKTAPPKDPTGIIVTRLADGTRKIDVFLPVDMDPDYAGVRIRYQAGGGGSWATATPLNVGLITSFPFETAQLPAGTYRFFAKAIDTTGNESVGAVDTGDVYLGDPPLKNVFYQQHAHDNLWPGTKTGCAVNGLNELEALDDGITTWEALTTWDAYTQWTASPVGGVTYEDTEIDLGAAVTFTPVVSAAGVGAPVYSVRSKVSAVDPWSLWQAPGLLTGQRYVQAKVDATGAFPLLRTLTTVIDVEVEVEAVKDLAVTTNASGEFTYPLTRTFADVTNAQITGFFGTVPLLWTVVAKGTTSVTFRVFTTSGAVHANQPITIDLKIEGPKG